MIIKNNNLFFEQKYDLGEDAIFNAAYAQHCDTFFIIDEKLYYYVYYPESLGHRYRYDNFAKHLPIFAARLPLVVRDMGEYCDIWLYHFINLFDNIFDKRNDMNLLQKFRYNQRMIKSQEFGYCIKHATGSNESHLTMKILKKRNYYLFWAFKQVVKIKEKLKK